MTLTLLRLQIALILQEIHRLSRAVEDPEAVLGPPAG